MQRSPARSPGGIFKQIPGVSLVWREVSLTIPAGADYATIKARLLAAAEQVLDALRESAARPAELTAQPT